MAESLAELLIPSIGLSYSQWGPTISSYLQQLQGLSLDQLSDSELQELADSSHKLLLSLQSLSSKSHSAVIASSDSCTTLSSSLPTLGSDLQSLQSSIPELDQKISTFSSTYGRHADTPILERRRKAMMLLRNADRLSDILELPTLLSSTIQSASASSNSSGASQNLGVNHSSTLDLHAHTKRLQALYPDSSIVADVAVQAEQAMQTMASNLIESLKLTNVKLAGGIRTIGWLRRIAPDLTVSGKENGTSKEGTLGALFLVCRLANLLSMLEALDPLRELADSEGQNRQSSSTKSEGTWAGGQQTEKYLKRYIEVFREQSFAIISMYRSIFPANPQDSTVQTNGTKAPSAGQPSPLQEIPSALATFPLHLTNLLRDTLVKYLPNVRDKTSRESLLTQVLYCAGSLGRLGGDFSMLLAMLEEDLHQEDGQDGQAEDWVAVVKKHRVLSSRLELLANGIGGNRGSA